MNWSAPQRPVDYAEQALITAILEGVYPPGTTLPGERDLAVQLGVTRPTLREVLRRLERDGWLSVRQGKPTTINHIWHDGGLNVLSAIVRYSQHLPPDFILNLLKVRLVLAPAITCAAVERAAEAVVALLADYGSLAEEPQAYAAYDWTLQRTLTILSGNPIYTLILNGFTGFYETAARLYFEPPESRAVSREFYAGLLDAARRSDANAAEQVTRDTMQKSILLWQAVSDRSSPEEAER